MRLEREELLDLVRTLAEAVSDAQVELAAIAEMPVPLSDELVRNLEQGEACRETLAWVRERLEAAEPVGTQALLDAYRAAAAAARAPTYEVEGVPVSDDTTDHLRRAEEELRRAVVLDGGVRDAMRYANLRDTFAGC